MASLARVPCILAICIGFHKTYTPPHRASHEETVHVGDWSDRWNKKFVEWASLAKAIYWTLGVAEILSSLTSTGQSDEPMSSFAIIGVALAVLGGWMRKRCYETLSDNFTFEMSLWRNHTLATTGLYSIVRHPSYSAILLQDIGIGMWHGSPGSWLRKSGVLNSLPIALFLALYSAILIITLITLFIRAPREDQLLKKHFGKQWDEWARKVPYMIIPSII